MERVIAFGRFWRDFVVGDDWTIAITVAWGLALLLELVNASINAWYILPFVVIVKMWLSVHQVWYAKAPETAIHKSLRVGQNGLWLLTLSLVVIPLVFFRLRSGDMSVAHFWLPVLLNALAAVILAAILVLPYRIYPFAAALVALVASVFVITDRLQAKLQILSENISTDSTKSYVVTATAALAVALCLFVLIRPPLHRGAAKHRG